MYIEAIKKRISVRSFTNEPIQEDLIKKIEETVNKPIKTPFETKCRFKLIKLKSEDKEILKGHSTYGVIYNSCYFIVGIVDKSAGNLVDFGFSFEKIILEMTKLGFGTCWLGGTFNKTKFSELARNGENDVIPCISPIGFSKTTKTMTDKIIRLMASSHKRKNWSDLFFQNNFKDVANPENQNYRQVLEMVRLAPSASNKQPWRVLIENDTFHFFLSRNSSYNKMINFLNLSDLQLVDMGIAMSHLELTFQELGLTGKFEKTYVDSFNKDLTYIISFQVNK